MDKETKHALRYVTDRTNKSGEKRWYWQRPGFDLDRLPDDFISRVARAYALNVAADGGTKVVEGSVAWIIQKYKASDDYQELRPATLTVYNRWLKVFETLWGALPVTSITPALSKASLDPTSVTHNPV